MKTASVPYTTARLMTTSISYRRYLSTAIAIVENRKMNATLWNTESHTGEVGPPPAKPIRNDSTTNVAPVANHLIWSRSSPTE